MSVWDQIDRERETAFLGAGNFPLRAYSELMPPPYIGVKPAPGARGRATSTTGVTDGDALDIDEYEQAHDLEPGLDRIAAHLVDELAKLMAGSHHALSRTLLDGNPAWPPELAAAATAGALAHDPLVVIQTLALSRTQDDKGNTRWTLFGGSHAGAAAGWWHGCDRARVLTLLRWAMVDDDFAIHAAPHDVPAELHPDLLRDGARLPRTVLTFVPFAHLPAPVRAAYLAGSLVLVPTPASLVFHEHPRYRALAAQLPHAIQIPLLHLFPRVERSCAIRIPQSGWLDEHDAATAPAAAAHGHRIVSHIARTHRWQRVARDVDVVAHAAGGDGTFTDRVSTALFSTTPEAVDLYDKPLARNAQLWTEDYQLLLDGPRADRAAIARAAAIVDAGGRFGYRMYYPPMRAGVRELFWHAPVIARPGGHRFVAAPGYVTAERAGHEPLVLRPHLLARAPHVAAARLFERDPGHARHTTSHNVRKLLEAAELHAGPIPTSLARALVHLAKDQPLADWLATLPDRAAERSAGVRLATHLRGLVTEDAAPGAARVLDALATRAIEEQIWSTIAHLAHGEFRMKNASDAIAVNRGRHGGPAAKRAHLHWHERRDLDALADHLHARYRALIEAAGLTGVAEVVDHRFRWETDFDFPWMGGWAENQHGPHERNVVMIIPGRDRTQAVVMGDHYDTAYMEDVFYAESGGDALRAPACGADDNHSATTALLLAAERLLPLAKAGKLERDVWLVHLTGEEFPPDCLGARALGQALVERSLAFVREDERALDVSGTRVVAAYVLDMIGHNSDRDRDVFQIACGEGAGSAHLATLAHAATRRWNALARARNASDPARAHAGRARRIETRDAAHPAPPTFAHLPLHGEVRVEWEPRSALYNTDGQIFSDLGIPVVLFMENYDISRKGYHDTHDTMENLDLDYCAALTAIAIETVAETACAPDLGVTAR